MMHAVMVEQDADPAPERGLEVVEFWRSIGPDGWFAKNDEVDRRFAEDFAGLHFAAARAQCMHWLDEPWAGLALILLLDQFPRNVFRGTGHAFATDPLALHSARRYLEAGHIESIDAPLRLFACLPFVHSENMADLDEAVELYGRYAPDSLDWAVHHRDIVCKFGRFPHRNRSLGRQSTPAEQAFLDDGGFAG